MSQDFGNGVTRTLSAAERQFQVVVWQAGKPPLDSELNLIMQADWERLANKVRSEMSSGWLLDPFGSDRDFLTNELWSNWFKVGNQETGATSPIMWANVNGWLVPVTGTDVVDGDTANRINLFAGPSTDSRIDLVFLEVWLAQVAPNPSTVSKPSLSTIWKYGNTEFGGTNISDDLEDPNIGFETTERVQLQYRLRVFGSGTGLGASVDLSTYPDGLDDPNVLAQGAATTPQTGFDFTNMRDTLGDPGLWRSGDGDSTNALSTVDGYVYAVPLCAVFRRNTASFVARVTAGGGNANQNGSLNRNPNTSAITDPVEGTRTFGSVTLTSDITEATTGVVQVEDLASSGFDNTDLDWDTVFLMLDDEVIRISAVDTTVTPGTITIRASGGRGRNATMAVPHDAGTEMKFFIFRPDSKTSDMITNDDLLDLRRGVTPGEWDYQALLSHNLGKLFENSLQSSYKQAGNSDTEGPMVIEVDTLYANGAFSVPNQTEALDGPDGIRTVFSDASVVQQASLILLPTTGSPGTPVANSDFTASAGSWDPAADFDPSGFQPDGGGWANQTVIGLHIGSSTLDGGARATVRTTADNRIVRFVSPREWWLSRDEIPLTDAIGSLGAQAPFQLRLISEAWGESPAADETSTNFPGPMFPLPDQNFERPFIVLGGIVNSSLRSTSAETLVAGSAPSGLSQVRISGLDFDTAGTWFATGDLTGLGTTGITNLLLQSTRNLFDMITQGGRDRSGASSELYLVLSTDTVNAANAGVFRVVGAGTAGYTTESGATAADLVVERVGVGVATLVANTGLTAEIRSQYTHTQDGNIAGDGASAVVVLTDMLSAAGVATSPWNGLVGALPNSSQMVLDTSIIYGPSRGGTARVADQIRQLALAGVDSATLIREAPTSIDTDFDSEAGVPDGDLYFPLQHIQMWNRLPSQGLAAPRAPGYGDEAAPGGEVRREAEAFFDAGSKTLVLRPYQRTDLTLVRYRATTGATNRFFPSTYAAGDFSGGSVDGGALFATGADYAYGLPWEFMPKFGRQDIPYHQQDGTTQTVYPGINHIFGDSQTDADDVFRVLGGQDSASGVVSLFFQTGTTSGRDFGEYYSMGGSASGYQARIYEDVTIYSSDVSKGLKGIQLPPFLGIARIYGVYDLREFSGQGAWDSDRVTKSTAVGRPTNLLREDSDKQTLFIVKGGASDVTNNADDHTYVIPQDNIDVRLSGQFSSGDTFDNMEFVVECVVFGFGTGFINKNNWVMARNDLPDGGSGTGVAALATQVSCILPLPLPYNEQVYTTYDRTVYQGDPYMTRNGSTKTVSDYGYRYGQIPQTSAISLATPIQQFDSTSNYDQVPQIPNARSLEVLASIDFYTTLGTGKIGGRVYPGTLLDVGHIQTGNNAPTRIPAASSDPIWQSSTRTFTEPQNVEAPRGQVTLSVLTDSTSSAGETVTIRRGSFSASFISDTAFSGGTAISTATSLVAAILASVAAKFQCGVQAYATSESVVIYSTLPGEEGAETSIEISPAAGNRTVSGFALRPDRGPVTTVGITQSALFVQGVIDPMNGKVDSWATTPLRMTGLTERLPVGILVQDSDFIGEDAMRDGSSALCVVQSGGSGDAGANSPLIGTQEYGRIQGAGQIGMADGSILQYIPWTLSTPTGATSFRLFRGGGSAYVLDPSPSGGPVDWMSGGFPEGASPVLKGAALAGRAFLVRNYPEQAFSGSQQRTWGDELQMVVLTSAVYGHGAGCDDGYSLDGRIGPTGYGEGFAASDRYRLEGKPMSTPKGAAPVNPVVELAPFDPSSDESDPDSC